MITKQELIDKNKEMNKQLLEQEQEIQQLKFKMDDLKRTIKYEKGIDLDQVNSIKLENECLKKVNKSLETQLNMLKEDYASDMRKIKDELDFYKSKCEIKNVRGAGRKPKATVEQIKLIQKLKSEGLSYSKIAKNVKLAVGTVYNIVNTTEVVAK